MMPAKKKSTKATKAAALRKAIGRVYDPRTGATIKRSVSAVTKVAKDIAKEYQSAVRRRNQAARKRFGGAKKVETQRRYNKEYQDAARRVARLSAKLQKAQDQLRETQRAVSEVRRTKVKMPAVLEVGINYRADKGPASDVNFNIRIRHKQGRGLTEADAMLALNAIASGNPAELPSYLSVSAVDWARPSKLKPGGMYEKRDMDASNAYSFASIVAEILNIGEEFRIGEVKPDTIGL